MSVKHAPRAVARRYARALLDVALAESAGRTEAPAEVRSALQEASAVLEAHPELARALSHPAIPTDARKKVAAAVWGQAPAIVKRLLRLLVERDRILLLPAIEEAYTAALNAQRGVVSAEAISAVELDGAQKQALTEALRTVTGQEVELKVRVDAAVLGGLRVSLEGRTYDGTVRNQLHALRQSLAEGSR